MNLTPEDFIAAGYTLYSKDFLRNADSLLQKAIWTECGTKKKYYINVWVYNWGQCVHSGAIPPNQSEWSFQSEVNLYREGKEGEEEPEWITLSCHNLRDINALESFYESAYNMFECVPDVHNND